MLNIKFFFKRPHFFIVIRFLDSIMSAFLPISIWFLFHDQENFAKFEYINGFSLLLSNWVDCGFSCYGYYGYKISVDRGEFLKSYLVGCCFFSVIACFISLSLAWSNLFLLISMRVTYQYSYRFFSNYFILKEKLVWVNLCSCGISALSFFLLLFTFILGWHDYVLAFLLPGFLISFVLTIVILYILRRDIFLFFTILMPAIKYSWSVIINCTLLAFVSSISKIILYNKSSISIMADYSLIQRVSGIIYLFHGVLQSSRIKSLFLVDEEELKKNYISYFYAMLFVCVFSTLSLCIFNRIFSLHFNYYVIFCLLTATMLACWNSSLELFFNRRNLPHLVLLVSIAYVIFFSLGLMVIKHTEVALATITLISVIFSLGATLIFIKYMCSIKKHGHL